RDRDGDGARCRDHAGDRPAGRVWPGARGGRDDLRGRVEPDPRDAEPAGAGRAGRRDPRRGVVLPDPGPARRTLTGPAVEGMDELELFEEAMHASAAAGDRFDPDAPLAARMRPRTIDEF